MNLYPQYQDIFKKYGVADVAQLINAWHEPHRFYHTERHLNFLLKEIEYLFNNNKIKKYEKEALIITAFYHDVVYDPTRQDNEQVSADFFRKHTKPSKLTDEIYQIILDTQTHQPQGRLSKIFCEMDMAVVSRANFMSLLHWERQIAKEYQFTDYAVYRQTRLFLLEKFKVQYPKNAHNLQNLIDYVKDYRPKIGVYPGSFNPFHNGHYNILEKAERILDKVIIARGVNPDKQDINTNLLQMQALKYRQTENFVGFLTDYLTSKEAFADVTLIRGLRNGDDLNYEVNQLRFMEDMKKDLKIIFITCDNEFEHISSSAIKNLDRIQAGFSERYMPK